LNEQPQAWQTINQTDRMQIEITPEYLASQWLSKTFPQRFWKKVDKNGPIPPHRPELGKCWKWLGMKLPGKRPYGYIGRGSAKAGKETAHRSSWILHNGPIMNGLHCLHKCDNAECTNPEHLFLGTPKQNTQDMIQKGRMNTGNHVGEHNGRAKTNYETVVKIRAAYVPWNITKKQLAKQFGVSVQSVKAIVEHKMGQVQLEPSQCQRVNGSSKSNANAALAVGV
jgi:HNH endonuclease